LRHRKFFTKANGTGAKPTQSQLSFSTKPKPKKDEEAKQEPKEEVDEELQEEPKSSAPEPIKKRNGATKREPKLSPDEELKDEVEEGGADLKAAEPMEVDSDNFSEAGKKRPAKEEEDSDDEPPTKRQRRKPAKAEPTTLKKAATKKAAPKKAGTAKTKKAAPKSKLAERVDEEDEDPVILSKSKEESLDSMVKEVEEVDLDDEDVEQPKKVKKAQPKAEKAEVEEDDEDPAPKKGAKGKKNMIEKSPTPASTPEIKDEEDEVLSSDEEPPEIKAKAREKVQSTFKAKTKDPYPDWKAGEPVPYAALCTTYSKVEMTTKRLEISAHCSLFLRQVLRLTPTDLLPTIMLMVNKLAADYAGIELGIGESLIMKAVSESTGRSLQHIKADQNEVGDLGLVAAKSRSKQPTMFKPKALTVQGVHKGFLAIAKIEGHGSQGRKVDGIKKLLSAADAHNAGSKIDITKDNGGASEAKFIVRTLEGKLRLGLAERTVIVALAHAMMFHETAQKGDKIPSTADLAKAESTLKAVYSELPSYEVIIPAMLEHGILNLPENCRLQPGVPLKPMLAKPTKSITEVLDRFEGKDFTCEYKYDGERAQIHFVAHEAALELATAAPLAGNSEKGVSNIFSRNSEDLSKKYPDILSKLPTWIKDGTQSFVLDCETVAWDLVEKKVLPFQQLMTRKRKDVKVEDVKVQVCVFAFDILYLNGEVCLSISDSTYMLKYTGTCQQALPRTP
jgi:DNA ligase-1